MKGYAQKGEPLAQQALKNIKVSWEAVGAVGAVGEGKRSKPRWTKLKRLQLSLSNQVMTVPMVT